MDSQFTPLKFNSSRVLANLVFSSLLTFSGLASAVTVLDTAVNVDNEFKIYLSTDPNSITGATLVQNGLNTYWGNTYTDTANLSGQTQYLIIEAINVGSEGGFEGSFSLSGSNYQFENGTQSLITGSNYWTQLLASTSAAIDPALTGTFSAVTNEGANGVAPWGTQSYYSGLAVQPDWIWNHNTNGSGGSFDTNTVYFETKITALNAVPLPPALFMFVSGVLGMAAAFKKNRRHIA